jgi:plasmid stability protein
MPAIQVRDVPDDVVAALKQRAADAGQSLTEFLRTELARIARQPNLDELWARVQQRGSAGSSTSAADILRAERDAR